MKSSLPYGISLHEPKTFAQYCTASTKTPQLPIDPCFTSTKMTQSAQYQLNFAFLCYYKAQTRIEILVPNLKCLADNDTVSGAITHIRTHLILAQSVSAGFTTALDALLWCY